MDLTESEDIKKRWQKYTEKLYKKGLNDPNYHDDMITHQSHQGETSDNNGVQHSKKRNSQGRAGLGWGSAQIWE